VSAMKSEMEAGLLVLVSVDESPLVVPNKPILNRQTVPMHPSQHTALMF